MNEQDSSRIIASQQERIEKQVSQIEHMRGTLQYAVKRLAAGETSQAVINEIVMRIDTALED